MWSINVFLRLLKAVDFVVVFVVVVVVVVVEDVVIIVNVVVVAPLGFTYRNIFSCGQ